MKTRHQKPEESLQEYAFEIQRLTTLAFSGFSAHMREMISFDYFMDELKDEEIQRAVRMADVQDLKSALLYALKFEAATQVSCIDHHSVREEDRSTKCWGCGGARHLRNNCPRINQKDPQRTSVIESKKVCSHRKGSPDGNIEAPSRRPCPENNKYSWRVEKKFGMIDPVVRQVITPSTSESDPWSDESVRKDQRADPELKQ
ncbi:uncharacterized protein TNCV_4032421 [Trichonephila clavipes]|nr:uncharacterized protein TNCV_4032421 [Trichonephila clavipes]